MDKYHTILDFIKENPNTNTGMLERLEGINEFNVMQTLMTAFHQGYVNDDDHNLILTKKGVEYLGSLKK